MCEPVNCPSEPEQLQCLDSSSRHEALEPTQKKEAYTKKEACRLSLKAALSREFHAHIHRQCYY